jgi:hypothetical protein
MVKEPIDKKEHMRLLAESDLETFIALVHPNRLLGTVHKELIGWWTRNDAGSHQLTLLPRDHMKSALIAYRAAWEVTRNPAIRILYISSTENLASKQLKFIKDILTSERYRFYWPDMVNEEKSKRETDTLSEFSVDHPRRKEESVRDPTIFIAGLNTSIIGMHCDIAILDDVVVTDNAYKRENREKVETQYSYFASIEGSDSREWIVGTRYHPRDLYGTLQSREVETFDEEGNVISTRPLYEVFQREVEDRGDGTGQFLWPRQQRSDGKWFGFDREILATKRAQYIDKIAFKAQYYNNPNDAESAGISRDYFQYYDQKYLTKNQGKWYIRGKRINVFAAVDFAFSLARRADFTSIVVVGIDADQSYYVLDIDRFKTDKISDYFNHILKLHQKWDFRKIRAEVTSAQKVIVRDLKDNYIRVHGLSLTVDDYSPNRHMGSKEERVEAILQPRYANLQIFHYPGGNCQILEEELVLQNPPHDDVKDCLSACIDVCVAPTGSSNSREVTVNKLSKITNSRFGGLGAR